MTGVRRLREAVGDAVDEVIALNTDVRWTVDDRSEEEVE